MAFDSTTRGKLQRLVADCRKLLTDEFDDQLQSVYGIYAKEGRVLDLDTLRSLDDDQRTIGNLLRERIAHLQSGLTSSKTPLADAVQRVLREQAFTILNRFAALRMIDERSLFLTRVSDGLTTQGFEVFEKLASPDLGSQYERYRVFLDCLFDELSLDLGVLFDRFSPFGLLFPREPKLKDFLALLNASELKNLWREDETIGWIYQYFNDEAERKKMREQSSAPRNSRELAVRNQFFTPRYVVEFLIDNTLGRLWYEMTKGRTQLARDCRYLVRRPNEVFLGNPNIVSSLDAAAPWVREIILTADFSRLPEDPTVSELSDFGLTIDGYGEMERRDRSWEDFIATFYNPQAEAADKTGQPWKGDAFELWCALFAYQREVLRNGHFAVTDCASGDQTLRQLWPVLRHALQNPPFDLSQEEMLHQPQFIPHRPIKDPREIRLLDPACGSMHFGLYAFDLFETIYAEAQQAHVEVGTEALRDSLDRVVSDVASDDKTAFLREVPRLIVEHNLHGIDIDPRAAQIAGLSLWLRAHRAWQRTGVKPADRPRITRSNLVCAEPMPGEKELLREFVEGAFPANERPAFAFLLEKIFDCMTLAGEAGSLLRIEEEIRTAIADARALAQRQSTPRQATLFVGAELPEQEEFNLRGLTTDEQFWEKAEERIYEALETYAGQAENGGGFQRRLFADDAAQGFAFIDLCRKRYDVVLMNPPFGRSTVAIEDWCKLQYENAYIDIYACFVTRCLSVLTETGCLGAITARSFFNAVTLERFREDIIPRLRGLVELGGQVLDSALVDTALTLLGQANARSHCVCIDMTKSSDKQGELKRITRNEGTESTVYVVGRQRFMQMPNRQLLYSLATQNLTTDSTFEPAVGRVRSGLNTFDDFRFLRLWWEVPPGDLGEKHKWCSHWKGGEYETYYSEIGVVCKWAVDGSEMRSVNFQLHGMEAQAKQSSTSYFRPGAAYTYRSSRGFSVRVFPRGCTFAVNGPVIQQSADVGLYYILGWLNSELIRALVHAQANSNLFTPGLVKGLPWIPPPPAVEKSVGGMVGTIIGRKAEEYSRQETGRYFHSAPILSPQESLKDAMALVDAKQRESNSVIIQNSDRITSEVVQVYSGMLSVDWANHGIAVSDHELNAEVVLARTDYGALLLSQVLGFAFGRWDIRYATGERSTPELPDPFAPLPACSPGMLQGDDGLPLSPEEGRQLYAAGQYPLDVAWDGILVDDPEHPLDFERRVHAALQVLWPDRADDLEHEACILLGVPGLREWFRRPAGFFADHLRRYSKSRRQAPIYWPLSTASGRYTLWLYYSRLTDQTLYRAVTDFVKPKLDAVTADVTRLQAKAQTGTARERAELEALSDFQTELQDLHDELLRVVQLPWKPNLNDGVLITASPLWKLFRLSKWQKDLKACWEELAAGDYDWAHLAHSIWPDRVRTACKTDRSLAIAHSLEDLCEVAAPKPKATKTKKNNAAAEEREAKKESIREELTNAFANVLLGEKIPLDIINGQTGEIIIPANRRCTRTLLRKLASVYEFVEMDPSPIRNKVREIIIPFALRFAELEIAEQAEMI